MPAMFKAIKKYLSEVKAEITKTSWPSKEMTKNFTILVVVVSLFLALYIGLFDFLLQKLMELFV